jgi:hypothetical protein
MVFAAGMERCSYCHHVTAQWRCAGCLHTYYCNEECQREDWRHAHNSVCQRDKPKGASMTLRVQRMSIQSDKRASE